MRGSRRYHLEVRALRILRPLGIAFFVLIALFPFYYMVLLSMREISEVIESPGQIFIPLSDLTADAYERVLKPTSDGGEGFVRFLINSALLGVGDRAGHHRRLDPRRLLGVAARVLRQAGRALPVPVGLPVPADPAGDPAVRRVLEDGPARRAAGCW